MSASNQDFIVGLDPTAYTSISGAQLAQLVDSGTPYSDKGLIVSTSDVAGVPQVPDASTTTKWQRYIWLRIGAAATTPYIWNPNAASDVTYLKWQTIAQSSIGPGVIVNSMIADNTIQDAKIVGLSYSKISGAPTGLPPSGAAGGDLTGTFPNPSVAASAITTDKINNLAVSGAKIAANTVTYDKLVSDSVANDMLRAKADGTVEWFAPNALVTADPAVVKLSGNALKIPRVNAGETAIEMVTTYSIGRILQVVPAQDNTAGTTNYTVSPSARPTETALPTTSNVLTPAGLQVAFTPISAASTLLIEVVAVLGISVTGSVVLGLFQDSTANALAATLHRVDAGGHCVTVALQFKVASGSTTARTYKVGYGATAGNGYINSNDGSTQAMGGVAYSNIKVTEYV